MHYITKTPRDSRPLRTRQQKGFTLLELGLVLGIIAVLVAILLPKGFDALRHARIQQVAKTVETAKTAIVNYLSLPGGNGNLPRTEGANIPVTGAGLIAASDEVKSKAARLDAILLLTGMLEKPISVRMGSQVRHSAGDGEELSWSQTSLTFTTTAGGATNRDWSNVTRLEARSSEALSPSQAEGANFRLDGITDLPSNLVVAYLVIPNCPGKDAYELATILNGSQLAPANSSSACDTGIVSYRFPSNGVTDVYIYLTAL